VFDEEQEVTAMAYSQKQRMIVIGSGNGRVKCFKFDVKEKFRDKAQDEKY